MFLYLVMGLSLSLMGDIYIMKKIKQRNKIHPIIGGCLCGLLGLKNGFSYDGLFYVIAIILLLVISVIDWKTYEIPPELPFLLGILGGTHMLLHLSDWMTYVIGMGCVSLLFLLIYYLSGGQQIGGGDIKLMAAAGLLLGWPLTILSLFLGSLFGSVIHLALMKFKEKSRVLAFGPYLSAGIICAMLFGEEVITWYLGFL